MGRWKRSARRSTRRSTTPRRRSTRIPEYSLSRSAVRDRGRLVLEERLPLDHLGDAERDHGLPRRVADLDFLQDLAREDREVLLVEVVELLDAARLHEMGVELPEL